MSVAFSPSSYYSYAFPASTVSVTGGLTIAYWSYVPSGDDRAFVHLTWGASDVNDLQIITGAGGSGPFRVWLASQNDDRQVVPTVSADTWHHIAVAIDPSASFVVYVDGVSVASLSGFPALTGTLTNLVVNQGITPYDSNASGAIQVQDMAVYTRTLTPADVANAAKSRRVDPRGLIAWYPFVDGGALAVDHSGNGRTLTATGTPVAGTSPPVSWGTRSHVQYMRAVAGGGSVSLSGSAVVSSTLAAALSLGSGLAGASSIASTLAGSLTTAKPIAASTTSASTLSAALVQTNACAGSATSASTLAATLTVTGLGTPTRFTGSAQYTRTVSLSGSQVHTLCAWARSEILTTDCTVIHLDNGTDTDSSRIGFVDSGSGSMWGVFVQHRTGAGSTAVLPVVSTAEWHHVALVIDGTNQVSYVDGVQVDSRAFDASLRTTAFTTIRIGDQFGTSSQDESIYDAQVYTSALTAAQLYTVMRGSIPGGATLYGRWMLDRADPLADTSGNGRTLSVTGTPGNAIANVLYGPGTQVSSTLAGSLATTKPLAATTTSASTLAATLTNVRALAGSTSVTSTLAASLGLALPIAGSSSSASTFSGTLTAQLTGSSAVASTLSATLGTGTQIAGAFSVASTLAAALTQLQALAGAQTVASTLTATLAQGVALAGAEGVASTLAGSLIQAQALAGTTSIASTLSASIGIGTQIAGSSSVASTLTAALVQAQALTGSGAVSSTLAATLGVGVPLTGTQTAGSTLSATLGVSGVFQGSSTVATTLTGTLLVGKPLTGSLSDASTLAAALSVSKPIAGTHAVSSTLAASLGTAKPLTGSSATASTLSAALQLSTALAGSTAASSTLAATLQQLQALGGTVGSASTLTAILSGGTAPILPVTSGWDDGGDVPDEPAATGTWVPEYEVEMAPHGKWHEDPVTGGIDTTWIAGRARSGSSLTGSVSKSAIEPSLVATLGGAGSYQLQKNWIFGANGNIGSAAALNAEFTYHDPFNTITNGTNYGAMIVRAPGAPTFGVWNYADIGMSNDQQPEDPGTRYREFTSDSMLAHVKPLNTGSTVVGPASAHNAGCGSLVSKLTYPAGGTRLGQTIVWETRCRMVTAPNGYWFALWIVGPSWDGGPEIDVIEGFSSTSPNVNGDLWNANGIGGSNSQNYFGGPWDNVISTLGFPGYALPNGAQSLRNWHTFTMEYKADNSFRLFMDSTLIQSGALDWKVPTSSTVPTLQFLFDFGFGHTAISPINTEVIADINATPLTYEIAYSRIWLR